MLVVTIIVLLFGGCAKLSALVGRWVGWGRRWLLGNEPAYLQPHRKGQLAVRWQGEVFVDGILRLVKPYGKHSFVATLLQ